MDVSLILQYLLIAVAVVVSVWVVMKKQFPGVTHRLRVAVAVPLLREGRAPWQKRLGRWVSPPLSNSTGSCGGCNSCGPSENSQR